MGALVTSMDRRYPLGAALTLEQLDADPYAALTRLRVREPVSWVPVLGGWLVTRRDLCIEVMRDAERFTVDDPRFSTAQVVGPSMLSLDGAEHARHRDPFARVFLKPEAKVRFAARIQEDARRLVAALAPSGTAEIRRDLAGPLAVSVVTSALELVDADAGVLLEWYDQIVAAVDQVSVGGQVSLTARAAVDDLARTVDATVGRGGGVLAGATDTLTSAEIASNAAVMLFGGIETSEGMTASLFWHLLSDPRQLDAVRRDRTSGARAVEESLRLEPAASRVDRYATADTELQGARIRRGDLVIVSLTAANRDPAAFTDPDRFDLTRTDSKSHVAFAYGPHACVGVHLARLETLAALDAVLDGWPDVRMDPGSTSPTGLIFRKPKSLHVSWGTTHR